MALPAHVSLRLTGGPFLSARDLSTSLRGGSRQQSGEGAKGVWEAEIERQEKQGWRVVGEVRGQQAQGKAEEKR